MLYFSVHWMLNYGVHCVQSVQCGEGSQRGYTHTLDTVVWFFPLVWYINIINGHRPGRFSRNYNLISKVYFLLSQSGHKLPLKFIGCFWRSRMQGAGQWVCNFCHVTKQSNVANMCSFINTADKSTKYAMWGTPRWTLWHDNSKQRCLSSNSLCYVLL